MICNTKIEHWLSILTRSPSLLAPTYHSIFNHTLGFLCLFLARQPLVGQGLLIHEVSRSHNDAPQSVELLWTSEQLVTETYT